MFLWEKVLKGLSVVKAMTILGRRPFLRLEIDF